MTSQASAFHLSVKTVSRTSRTERLADGSTRTRPGRTAVAAAAYRAARLLRRYIEGRIALTHDFRAKRGVIDAYIVAPTGADWALDRETLWNRAEDAERRVNSTTAREYEIAIPADLPEAERRAIVRDFAQSLVDQFGIAADVALHAPSAAGDQRNFHAHVLTTTRVVTPTGLGAKTRALDARATGPALVEEVRARWASICNHALERAGSTTRVDHRSYARRSIARIPTIHSGHRVTALARRLGVATGRFTENATIREHNARLDALRALLRAAAAAPPAPAPLPVRLTVPGLPLTRPSVRLTRPPVRPATAAAAPPAPAPLPVRLTVPGLPLTRPSVRLTRPPVRPATAAAAPPAPAPLPVRLTVPGLRLTRPVPTLTRPPPPVQLETQNEREREPAPRPLHQPVLQMRTLDDRGIGNPSPRHENTANYPALSKNKPSDLVGPRPSFRPDRRPVSPPDAVHEVFREGTGIGIRPLGADDSVLKRSSDRIAEAISPGRRFEANYASFIDARVADRVDEIRAHVHDGRLARIAAADAALRAAQATGNRAAIRSAEMVAAGARRVSAPDAAEMLRAAEANVAAKLRASMARSDKDAQVEQVERSTTAARSVTKPIGPTGMA